MREAAIHTNRMWRCYIIILVIAMSAPHIAGCLAIPYTVTPDVTIDKQVYLYNDIVLTLDPRDLLDKFSDKIAESYMNIEVIDVELFRNTAFTEETQKLSQLLESNAYERISENLGIDYLVIVGKHEFSSEKESDHIIPPIAGTVSAVAISRISAVIFDLKTGKVVCQINSAAQGKEQVAFYIVIVAGTVPLTYSSAIKGLARETGKVIDEFARSEKTRIVIMATESTFSEFDYMELLDEQSLKWLCEAADQGQAYARKELGMLYLYGSDTYRESLNFDVPANLTKSCMWLHLAGLADITTGTWKESNDRKVIFYETVELKRTASVISPQARLKAKKLIESWEPGQCMSDIIDHAIGEDFNYTVYQDLCYAADMGDFSSRDKLGMTYFVGSSGIKNDDSYAYLWYHKAAEVHPLSGHSAQGICDSMSQDQLSFAVKMLNDWAPGKCEQELFNQ